MSFLNRSLLTMVVVGSTFLSANAQSHHWPRTPVQSYPVQGPCLPGVVPTQPSMPGQVMPSTPTMPVNPMTPSPMPGTLPTTPTTPTQPMTPSPLTGQVEPITSGVGDDTAFVDRGGSSSLTSLTPMIGDLGLGAYVPTVIRLPDGRTILANVRNSVRTAAPLVARNSFKIQENETARPTDRIFGAYNYFNDLRTDGSTRLDLHRETIGFEKTLFDRRASIGFRLPFLQTNASPQGSESGIGDLSIVGKYVVRENRDTGSLMTVGTVVTVPTGSRFDSLGLGGDFKTTYIQPWVGGLVNFENFYLQGFTSLAFPTDGEQTTFLFSSLGLNYRLYQNFAPDARLRFVVPTIEGHLTSPLNNRGLGGNSAFGFPDIFVLTGGSHFGIGQRATLTTAIGLPLTGPRPFSFEGILQLNIAF